MKTTGFKSLRINCWNITQVMWICKIFSSTLTSIFSRIYLKDKCIKPPLLIFSCEYTNFLKQQKQTPEVFCKKVFLNISRYSQENTCVRASLVSLESTLLKRDRYFPVNITKFLRAPVLKNIWERLHLKQLF